MAKLITSTIRAGIWEGAFEAEVAVPERIEVRHLEQPLGDVTVVPDEREAGRFTVRVAIPADLLSDGVQTFLVRDVIQNTTLAHFTIIAGVALEADLRAEIDLLRAELDMLKRAFRRHCLETAL